MLYMGISKDGPENEEDIKKYAKKIGYNIVQVKERGKSVEFVLEKKALGRNRLPITKEQIIELQNQGKTSMEIAKELGVARSSLYVVLKRNE